VNNQTGLDGHLFPGRQLMSAELDHKLFGSESRTGGTTAIFEVSAVGDDPQTMFRMQTVEAYRDGGLRGSCSA